MSSWVSPSAPASSSARVERAAQLGDLDEVVEVAGLQAGVLPVVDEGQQLACLGRELVSGRSREGCARSEALSSVTALERPSASSVASLPKSLPRTCS